MIRTFHRVLSTTSQRFLKQITETTKNNVTVVSLTDVPEPSSIKYLKTASQSGCPMCNCKLPQLSYTDVLILEQFMREDGTVLPKELTGTCNRHQKMLERCVMQSHWSGLFPDRTTADFDRSGYKRFSRWWKSPNEIFNVQLKKHDGSWYYIKRYNPKLKELQESIDYDKNPANWHKKERLKQKINKK